jgi:cell division protein FtsB
MRRAVRLLLAAVALGGLVFLFVLPGRTWLEQRSAMSTAQHRLQVLESENAALSQRITQLQDPAYIARTARQQYGLILPGQRVFAIEPTSVTTTTVPSR